MVEWYYKLETLVSQCGPPITTPFQHLLFFISVSNHTLAISLFLDSPCSFLSLPPAVCSDLGKLSSWSRIMQRSAWVSSMTSWLPQDIKASRLQGHQAVRLQLFLGTSFDRSEFGLQSYHKCRDRQCTILVAHIYDYNRWYIYICRLTWIPDASAYKSVRLVYGYRRTRMRHLDLFEGLTRRFGLAVTYVHSGQDGLIPLPKKARVR